jgi:hypothetical protein
MASLFQVMAWFEYTAPVHAKKNFSQQSLMTTK